jgi:hypothetical protein
LQERKRIRAPEDEQAEADEDERQRDVAGALDTDADDRRAQQRAGEPAPETRHEPEDEQRHGDIPAADGRKQRHPGPQVVDAAGEGHAPDGGNLHGGRGAAPRYRREHGQLHALRSRPQQHGETADADDQRRKAQKAEPVPGDGEGNEGEQQTRPHEHADAQILPEHDATGGDAPVGEEGEQDEEVIDVRRCEGDDSDAERGKQVRHLGPCGGDAPPQPSL